MIAALSPRFRRGGPDAFKHGPRAAVLSEYAEHGVAGQGVDVQLRAGARRLAEHRDNAVAAGRNDLERLSRQLRASAGRCDVHHGRGPGHGDRLRQRADLQHDVHLRLESDRQPQILTPHGAKTLERVLHGVGPDGQRREAIFAPVVGDVDQLPDL